MVIVCLDVRSTYNIGSILRTCDGFGVEEVYCTGLTPHTDSSDQPPHVRSRWLKEIAKTALGAEQTVKMKYMENPITLINELKSLGYIPIALEQAKNSVPLASFYSTSEKLAVLLGSETNGIPEEVLEQCSKTIEIPMIGIKESFNVSVACGICLYHLKHMSAFKVR